MTPLRQRMIDDMQLRNLAPATQRNYIYHVARFASYYGLSPEKLDLEDIRQFHLYLLNDRKYSPEAVNQSVSALKFVYRETLEMPWSDEHFPRARRQHKLPLVATNRAATVREPFAVGAKIGRGAQYNFCIDGCRLHPDPIY